MTEEERLTAEQFTRSRSYLRARRVQVAMLVTAPASFLVGVSAVHFLFPRKWAMLAVILLVALQALVFLVAEGWKTVAFGRDAFRAAGRLRSAANESKDPKHKR